MVCIKARALPRPIYLIGRHIAMQIWHSPSKIQLAELFHPNNFQNGPKVVISFPGQQMARHDHAPHSSRSHRRQIELQAGRTLNFVRRILRSIAWNGRAGQPMPGSGMVTADRKKSEKVRQWHQPESYAASWLSGLSGGDLGSGRHRKGVTSMGQPGPRRRSAGPGKQKKSLRRSPYHGHPV